MNSLASISGNALPNLEMLRNQGWRIRSNHGRYCVAWLSPHVEVLMVWRNNGWHRVHGGGMVA